MPATLSPPAEPAHPAGLVVILTSEDLADIDICIGHRLQLARDVLDRCARIEAEPSPYWSGLIARLTSLRVRMRGVA